MNLASPLDYLGVFKTSTRARWDMINPLALIGLSLFGVAFIYSAQLSVHGSDWIKQIVFLCVGAGLYVGVSLIDYRFWLGVAHWIYFLAIIPLLIVFIPGVGGGAAERWGATRLASIWASSPSNRSETAKVAVLLITGEHVDRATKWARFSSLWASLGKLALAVGAPMLLVSLQPDLKLGDRPAPDGVFHALRFQVVRALLRRGAGRVPAPREHRGLG